MLQNKDKHRERYESCREQEDRTKHCITVEVSFQLKLLFMDKEIKKIYKK